MNPSSTTSISAPASVEAGRIKTLDILRGLALMGILIVHFVTGPHWMFATPEQIKQMPFGSLNQTFGNIVDFLFTNKSRTLFAFMFGISFFLQLQKAEERNLPFQKPFLWRLLLLMILGVLHAHLLFGGDILRYYAIGGLLLLLVYKWSSTALLITGVILFAGVPFLTSLIVQWKGIDMFKDFIPLSTMNEAYMSGSFKDNVWINHIAAMLRYHWFFLLFFAVPSTGVFLFGIWMGRRNYLHRPDEHVNMLRRFTGWGLSLGLLLQVLILITNQLMAKQVITGNAALFLSIELLSNFATLLLALGYVCGLTLLCLRPGWVRYLSVLAPAGRMTLTNYVVQSIFLWIIFNGSAMGLYLKVGPVITLPIALVLCAFQLACSAWWLRHFKMGPLEWVWRWAIQGKRPVLRNSTELQVS